MIIELNRSDLKDFFNTRHNNDLTLDCFKLDNTFKNKADGIVFKDGNFIKVFTDRYNTL